MHWTDQQNVENKNSRTPKSSQDRRPPTPKFTNMFRKLIILCINFNSPKIIMNEPYDRSRRLIESFHSKKKNSFQLQIIDMKNFLISFSIQLTLTFDFLLFLLLCLCMFLLLLNNILD